MANKHVRMSGLDIQDVFHYGLLLAGQNGAWRGYESAFVGKTAAQKLDAARRGKALAGLRGVPVRTAAQRRVLGFALIVAACVDAAAQGIDPDSGNVDPSVG